MKIDLKKFGFEYPVKTYEFGTMWQVRDLRSRDVLTIQATKLDFVSRRKNSELIKFIVDSLNSDCGVREEIKVEEQVTQIMDGPIPGGTEYNAEIEKPKKRGRPKKNG